MSKSKKYIGVLVLFVASSLLVFIVIDSPVVNEAKEDIMSKIVGVPRVKPVKDYGSKPIIRAKGTIAKGTVLTPYMVDRTYSADTEYVPEGQIRWHKIEHFYGQRAQVEIKKDAIMLTRFFIKK